MRLLLNVLWFVLGGGFLIAIEYLLAGIVLCLTVVGIPFGLQCFKIAGLGMAPFGRDVVHPPRPFGILRLSGAAVWFLLAGLWIALTHLAAAVSLAVTLIGIPFAIQHVKLALLALNPFGSDVR